MASRRKMLGKASDFSDAASSLLMEPGSLRNRALVADNQLCQQLNNEMYKEELYKLAKELRLPGIAKATKKELCEMISVFVNDMARSTFSSKEEDTEDIAEGKLKKALRPISQSLIDKYNYYLAPFFGPIDTKNLYDFLYHPETGLIGEDTIYNMGQSFFDEWLLASGETRTPQRFPLEDEYDEDTMIQLLKQIPKDKIKEGIKNYTDAKSADIERFKKF
ncbi:MAG: hypothetical protein WD512_00025, partial [Candidatus Paceibacterota bacterium]